MKTNKRTTYVLFGGAIALVALAAAAMPNRPKPAPPLADLISDDGFPSVHPPAIAPTVPQVKEPPKVEVVFALDTTGSMEGLIEGAKRKIWSIANFIASAQPKPDVRIGLVAYRDVGDAYVTRFYDLSDDLDGVFEKLASFRAEGGGDTPEHVAKALHDAIERTHWSDGDKVLKLVYLVGDAPPHTDYHDGYDFRAESRKAAQKGIKINTILCGNDREAEVAWRQVASLGHGEYASIAQSGGVAVVATPFDTRLAELNRRLAGTALGYGTHRREVAAKVAASKAAPAPMAADRAGWAGRKGVAVAGDGELLNDLAIGKAHLGPGAGGVSGADLPEAMRLMTAEQQQAFVGQKQAERKAVLDEINTVNAQRNAYLKSESKKAKRPAGFDDEVRHTVEKQAAGMLAF